jgi:DNA topoisomerase IB
MPRLRRSNLSGPGITRRRCGRGFCYQWTTGDRVSDRDNLERITALVIPPAWTNVWICPWPIGHIQAVGTDAAGRRQYRYHDDWRKGRDKEKFQRALAFGAALPQLRRAVRADLASPGLGRRRVVATGIRLLDIGCFRVGGEEYAEENDTYGIATLRIEHARVTRGAAVFEYPAKGSIMRTVSVSDPDVLKVIRSLRRGRAKSDDLLAWKEAGQWTDVRSADLNAYIKEEAGEQFSAKDFRTWSATVYAGVVLARDVESSLSVTRRGKVVTAAVKEVAEYLGNTPAVCRSSYIDPRIIDRFEEGETIAATLRAIGREVERPELNARIEQAVMELLGQPADAAAAAA